MTISKVVHRQNTFCNTTRQSDQPKGKGRGRETEQITGGFCFHPHPVTVRENADLPEAEIQA